jgi:ABC-type branched-subunit amino acid transport system substrate-binding protein
MPSRVWRLCPSRPSPSPRSISDGNRRAFTLAHTRTRVRWVATIPTGLIVSTALGLAGCGRSSSPQTSASSTPATSSSASTAVVQPGTFATLKNICGSGTAKGATARGVTDTSINITTLGDPGNSVEPGLFQEMFDASHAFVNWCNAAGGINGRKIVLHTRDAKLFNGAARIIDACRTDFMAVGGGTTSDAGTVKPRLACGLGAIPALTISPEAGDAGLQVQPVPIPTNTVFVGGARALAAQDPTAGAHIGLYVTNISSVAAIGARERKGLIASGLAVPDFQEFPYSVTNWRPYLERSKNVGTKVVSVVGIASYAPFISGMQDIGYKPTILASVDAYQDNFTKLMATTPGAPPVYIQLQALPFELANQVPAVKAEVDLLTTTRPLAQLTGYSSDSLSAWLLWAKSATECGSDLTVSCVLQKAKANRDWDAGGFMGPVDLTGSPTSTDCMTIMKASASGFIYQKAVTKPNQGFFNCDPKNIQSVS